MIMMEMRVKRKRRPRKRKRERRKKCTWREEEQRVWRHNTINKTGLNAPATSAGPSVMNFSPPAHFLT